MMCGDDEILKYETKHRKRKQGNRFKLPGKTHVDRWFRALPTKWVLSPR